MCVPGYGQMPFSSSSCAGVKSFPPCSSQSLPPFPRKNSRATWLSLPSASEVGMKSLRVKQAEQETLFTCLVRTETRRGESRDPGWESVTLSADPRRNGTQEVSGASRRRRRWACQRAVCTEAFGENSSACTWEAQTGEGQWWFFTVLFSAKAT